MKNNTANKTDIPTNSESEKDTLNRLHTISEGFSKLTVKKQKKLIGDLDSYIATFTEPGDIDAKQWLIDLKTNLLLLVRPKH